MIKKWLYIRIYLFTALLKNIFRSSPKRRIVYIYTLIFLVMIGLLGYANLNNTVVLKPFTATPFTRDALTWQDDFVDNNHYSRTSSRHLFHNFDHLEFDTGDNQIDSECISLDSPRGTVFKKWKFIDLRLLNSDSMTDKKLQITDCSGKELLSFNKIIDGINSFDIEQIDSENQSIMLHFSGKTSSIQNIFPFRRLKMDFWRVVGSSGGTQTLSINSETEIVKSNEKLIYNIKIASHAATLKNLNLIVDLQKGYADGTTIDIQPANNLESFRSVSIVEASVGPRGEKAEIFANPIPKIVYALQNMNPDEEATFQMVLKVDDGFVDKERLIVSAELDYGSQPRDDIQTYKPQRSDKLLFDKRNRSISTAKSVTIHSQTLPNIIPYDRYSNLGKEATNLWTMFFIDDKLRDDTKANHSDHLGFNVRVDLGIGSCKPIFRKAELSKLLDNDNFDSLDSDPKNDYEIVHIPEANKELTSVDYFEVRFKRWVFGNIYRGMVIRYDIEGSQSCKNGTDMQFVARGFGSEKSLPDSVKTYNQTTKITHKITEETCGYQNFQSRDVIRIDQTLFKSDGDYWPEWRIGKEANCYNIDKDTEKGLPETPESKGGIMGSLAPGEYFMTTYWMNEQYRSYTKELDWFYLVYELPEGTAYRGNHTDLSIRQNGNYYESRQFDLFDLSQKDSLTEIYKADLNDAQVPDAAGFDKNNMTKNGWFESIPDKTPLNPEDNIRNPNSSLYFRKGQRQAIMIRTKNLKPAWKRDFFLPNVIMQVCNGDQSCQPPVLGSTFVANKMKAYSQHQETCKFCGQSNFGTVRVEEKSFPQVYLDVDKQQANPGQRISLNLTPENNIMASKPVDGVYEIDLTSSKSFVDFSAVEGRVSCEGCDMPRDCRISDIVFLPPTESDPKARWDLSKAPNCRPNRGWGKVFPENLCHDSYHPNFTFNLVLFTKKDTPPNSVLEVKSRVIPTNATNISQWSENHYSETQKVLIKPPTI